MKPSKLQVYLFGLLALLALVAAIASQYLPPPVSDYLPAVWWSSGVALLVIIILDLLDYRSYRPLTVSRKLPGSFSLGSANAVRLTIKNPLTRPVILRVYDQYPVQVKVDVFPCELEIPPGQHGEIVYKANPVVRGDVIFGLTHLRVLSKLKLWEFDFKRGKKDSIKIYPNFANISKWLTLEHGQQINQMGIHVQQRRGEGINFHQLREYRVGDSISQIDWKATARHVKLISREYEDEKDQEIIFLLDCGRRMRSIDGELSHFDHSLNALLLTSYIALKQGDSVGLLSFAGDTRWIPPIKGPTAINKLLNSVYDLHSTTRTSDLVQAAEEIMIRHRKRALVIIISNIREEDELDLLTATKTLSRKHLVMVASLREKFLDEVLQTPVNNFDAALRYSGVTQLVHQRSRLIESLVYRGVVILDSLAKNLHIDLANQYLNLKRSGRI